MKRPRFSLRTLAIVVTLICAYFAAWEATKKYGWLSPEQEMAEYSKWLETATEDDIQSIPAIGELEVEGKSPMPFILSTTGSGERRHYYLWLLGPKIKLW